jgi:integrase
LFVLTRRLFGAGSGKIKSEETMPEAQTKQGKKKSHFYGKGVSIYYKGDQNRWMCSIRLEDGKRKYVSGAVGAPYEACEDKFKQAIEQAKGGELIPSSTQTLREYIDTWLEEKRITMKKGVYPKWKNYLDNHVIADLGSWKLQKLKREHIQAWAGRMIKKNLAASTIHLIHEIFSLAMKDAVKRGILSSNPCDHVSLPRIEEKEMQFFDPKQARALFGQLRGNEHEALFTLAITTGMRQGELQALRWEDIDFDNSTVQVRRTVVYLAHEGYHENEPKSRAGRRTIPLTQQTLDALRFHKKRQDSTDEDSLVFCGRGQGGYLSSTGMRLAFDRILEDAGLPHIRFHDLRHTAATLLLRSGASLKSIQKILGHASIQTTMRYVHLLPEMLEEDIERLGKMLFAAA